MHDIDSRWQSLLQRLHARPLQIAMVFSGGGTRAIGQCFGRSGASKTFVEAIVPYSRRSMIDYLSTDPVAGSASLATARQLAQRARERSRKLSDLSEAFDHCVGVALVAALPTTPSRRGHDRVHVVAQQVAKIHSYSVEFPADQFDRSTAEMVGEEMVWMALAGLVDAADTNNPLDRWGLELSFQTSAEGTADDTTNA